VTYIAIPFVMAVMLLQGSPPLFEIDLWPGEGRPVLEAVSNTLELRQRPSNSSTIVASVSVAPKQRLSFDDTRYRTIEAGRISVLAPARVTGRLLGPLTRLSREDYYKGKFATANVEVHAGTEIDYLQYRAEGTCFVRIGGNAIGADLCPAYSKSTFRVVTQPKTECWIHVVVGKSAGWTFVTDAVVKVVNRSF
jgi:hypothetical protein